MFGSLKRVISNPDEIGNKEGKISKTSADRAWSSGEVAPEKNLATIGTPRQEPIPAVVEVDDDDVTDATAKGTCRCSTLSTAETTSSLMDASAAVNALDIGTESVARTVLGSPKATSSAENSDSRMLSETKGSTASSSSSSSSSGKTGGTAGTGQASSGNWGWFEDVHDHDHAGKGGTGNDAKKGREGKDGAGHDHKKTGQKKGGMLHFSDSLDKPLHDIVEPPKDTETTAMAVTAPTYVLEESLSNQKLWKHTAGNRPPQPVEERAFFEKMWAQNFQRSQVKYHIPHEVLTATSPISLSPFADGNFGDEGAGGGHGAELSNYNLAAPFNANGANRIGAGMGGPGDAGGIDSSAHAATVKAAEADAAEATLMHRMGNASTWGLYDPTKPKDYSLKMLGPHHHHHTLVNKKVKGDDSNDEMTVKVRGDNVFGTTVSKSFAKSGDRGGPISGVETVSISIASYRVVESKKQGKYAQFLVIYCEGSFRDTVGVWKRYSDFDELSRKVTHGHESCASVLSSMHPLSVTEDPEGELLPNAVTSWRLLKKRQRWFRCLDAGYLSLKVFLLERFLHDILFESSNPQILRDFVGVDAVAMGQ